MCFRGLGSISKTAEQPGAVAVVDRAQPTRLAPIVYRKIWAGKSLQYTLFFSDLGGSELQIVYRKIWAEKSLQYTLFFGDLGVSELAAVYCI